MASYHSLDRRQKKNYLYKHKLRIFFLSFETSGYLSCVCVLFSFLQLCLFFNSNREKYYLLNFRKIFFWKYQDYGIKISFVHSIVEKKPSQNLKFQTVYNSIRNIKQIQNKFELEIGCDSICKRFIFKNF